MYKYVTRLLKARIKDLIEKNKSAPTPTWWNPEVEQLQSAIKLLKESEDK